MEASCKGVERKKRKIALAANSLFAKKLMVLAVVGELVCLGCLALAPARAATSASRAPSIKINGIVVPCSLQVIDELPFHPVRMTCHKEFDRSTNVPSQPSWDHPGGFRCTSEPGNFTVMVICERDIYVR